MKPSLGIIGTGSFGKFVANKTDSFFRVKVVGRRSSEADFAEAAACDYVVLAIPFDAYDTILPRLKPLLKSTTVLVDVCSVKILPVKAIRAILPKQPLLVTHPLFGPESANDSLPGHTIVICPQPGNEDRERIAKGYFESLGLKVELMSEDKHDSLMAELHALTFFVARTLDLYGIKAQAIATPSFSKLLSLANLEKRHSAELFATIQLANPYAPDARHRYLEIANRLNETLNMETIED